MCAGCRFVILILFYAVINCRHWFPVAVSARGEDVVKATFGIRKLFPITHPKLNVKCLLKLRGLSTDDKWHDLFTVHHRRILCLFSGQGAIL